MEGVQRVLSYFVVIPVVLVMIIAVYTDLRSRLIYDWLTLPGIAYFLIYHAFAHPDQWTTYGLGVILIGGITLLMAVVSNGQLGGGDIKLFTLVGAAVGWEAGLYILCFTYLLAGLIVIPIWLAAKVSGKQAAGREIPLAPFIAGGTSLLLMAVAFI
ncbi:prepilin peptidase [Brevibacillus nitrificans]|uniref:Prepilin peptidase n=1 Tax=Brevibacillus nitrificans TaxID=651560 RepID=A0A3M8CSM9_9BACL|nr:prepilin peptidase [Brevibacillus nitrificans]